MAWPTGVQLSTVKWGKGVSTLGDGVNATLTITVITAGTEYLVWSPTGDPFLPLEDMKTSDANFEGFVLLPFVDQPGWIDSAGNAYSGWGYQASIRYTKGNRSVVITRTIAPVMGQNTIDLDVIPDMNVGSPTIAAIPAVLSVNGMAGHVILGDGTGTGGGISESGLTALLNDTASDPRVLLDQLYGGGATAITDPAYPDTVLLSAEGYTVDPADPNVIIVPDASAGVSTVRLPKLDATTRELEESYLPSRLRAATTGMPAYIQTVVAPYTAKGGVRSVGVNELVINPADHGADWVTTGFNNSTAIQAAIDYGALATTLTGRPSTVKLPSGDFTAEFTLKGSVLVEGSGRYATTVRPPTGSTRRGVVMLATGPVQNARMRNLRIFGVGNTGQGGVYLFSVPTGTAPSQGGMWYGGIEDIRINGVFTKPYFELRAGSNGAKSPHQFLTFRNILVSAQGETNALRITGAAGQVTFEGINEFDGPGVTTNRVSPNIWIGREEDDNQSFISDYSPYAVVFNNTTIQGAKSGVVVERARTVTFNQPYFEEIDQCFLAKTSGQGLMINGGTFNNAGGAVAGDGSGYAFKASGGSNIYIDGTPSFAGRLDKLIITDSSSNVIMKEYDGFPAISTTGVTQQRAVQAGGILDVGRSTTVLVNTSATPITSITSFHMPGTILTLKALAGSIVVDAGAGVELGGNTGPITIAQNATITLRKMDTPSTKWVMTGQSVGGGGTSSGTGITQAAADLRYSPLEHVQPMTSALHPKRARKTILYDFSNGNTAAWLTNLAGGGTVSRDDISNPAMGSQSLAMFPGSPTTSDVLYRYNLPPVDMTGKDFAILIKVDNAANLGTMTWKTPTGTGSAGAFTNNLIPSALLENNRWMWITLPFTNTASANRTTITGFELAMKRSSANLPVKVSIQAIATVPISSIFPQGALSLDFDDGYGEHYTAALPILSRYDFRGSVYPVVEQIQTATNAMTVAQLQELQNTHGWTVGAHSDTWAHHNAGLAGQTVAEMEAGFRANRDWLNSNGLTGGDFFAYPGGNVDQNSVQQVREYYAWARSLVPGPYETLPAGDFAKTRAVAMSYNSNGSAATQADAKKLIDDAVATRTHINMVFHNLATVGDSTHYAIADLQYLVAYAASVGIYVGTADEILALLRRAPVAVYPVVVNHGSNASTPRPVGPLVVIWVGTVTPTNMTAEDIYDGPV